MISSTLLSLTDGHALGTVAYGGAGLRKSLAKHTLPGPILDFDFESGNVALLPWTRRRRRWNESSWTEVSQDYRVKVHSLIPPAKQSTGIQPNPLIDTIWYDNTDRASYLSFVSDLGNFDPHRYNSISLDSLAEFSVDVQSFSKSAGQESEPLPTNSWGGIQERTAMQLRRMRNYRDHGVFIYLIGQENIDKDYVTDPRSTKRGEQPPEPFSIKGSVDVPGKMVNAVQHITDLMFHCRTMNGGPVWVTVPEPIGGSGATWEAKDRTGRIKDTHLRPNFRTIFKDIYGEDYERIYESAAELIARG